jgi:hypothetical protein
VFVVIGMMARSSGTITTPSFATAAPPPATFVQASQIAADYAQNSVAADAKYKGQSLRVEGKVVAINTDLTGSAVVVLDGRANQFLQPQAVLAPSERGRASGLRAGEMVVVLCVGAGDVLKAPMLRDCRIE